MLELVEMKKVVIFEFWFSRNGPTPLTFQDRMLDWSFATELSAVTFSVTLVLRRSGGGDIGAESKARCLFAGGSIVVSQIR